MDLREFQSLKEQRSASERYLSRLQGQLEAAIKRLLDELGYADEDEVIRGIKDAQKKLTKLEAEYELQLAAYRKRWGDGSLEA